ncbi:UDP-glucose/GDP-mannose dehydrogenase family protein [Acetobacteraceae bacterium]|nr:UDP-glucose/GDP-mannose dehydrogenase family protein [Acetobacteraceae bacterium]
MKLVVVGGGYVGLVSAVCFAKSHVETLVLEKNEARLALLKKGQSPIYEPGLSEALREEILAGHLSFSASYKAAMKGAEAVFIAVGTPALEEDSASQQKNDLDLSQIDAALNSIAENCASSELLVVVKSTVPTGTCQKTQEFLQKKRPEVAFTVLCNPEFLREGTALKDFMNPDRILIGLPVLAPKEKTQIKAFFKQLYREIDPAQQKTLFVSLESAELAKSASNVFLAMKASFINEMADVCEATGADILEVAQAMGQDVRIGPHFLKPGPGIGGACFPKDSRALVATAQANDLRTDLLQAVMSSNKWRQQRLAERISERLGGVLKGKWIGVLGVAFKAGTDDVRDAPALSILPYLLQAGALLQIYDPQAMENAKKTFEKMQILKGKESLLRWMKAPEDVAEQADLILLLTEWGDFEKLSPSLLAQKMRGKKILDYRNCLERAAFEQAGLDVEGLGRGNAAREDEKHAQDRR